MDAKAIIPFLGCRLLHLEMTFQDIIMSPRALRLAISPWAAWGSWTNVMRTNRAPSCWCRVLVRGHAVLQEAVDGLLHHVIAGCALRAAGAGPVINGERRGNDHRKKH